VTWLGEPPAPAAVGMPRRAAPNPARRGGPRLHPQNPGGALATRQSRRPCPTFGCIRTSGSEAHGFMLASTSRALHPNLRRSEDMGSTALQHSQPENVTSDPSRIAAAKAFLEQKFHLTVCSHGLGNPRWRDDDPTSNLFGSDARVDTLACRVGIVAWRSPAR
jgi:hypothetical protein